MAGLLRRAPRFYISGDGVQVLSSPAEFHARLQSNVQSARRKISLASLYFGTADKEEALALSLARAHDANPDLRIRVLLDHSRGTRLGAPGPGGGRSSSASLLAEHLPQHLPPELHRR